jgi:ABC-2 type transport system permease protein
MTTQSLGSIVGRGDLIRKIRIPRWIIIISSSLSALVNFALNLAIVVIFMAINHVDVMQSILWFPLVLLEVYIFALGVSLFLSAAFVKFRDIGYIWEVCLQAAFYLTPIIYPISIITNVTLQKLLFLSPITQAMQDARYSVITHQSVTMRQVYGSFWYELIPIGVTLIVLVVGVLYFKKESKYFAENI